MNGFTPFVLSPKETVLSTERPTRDWIMCTHLWLRTYPEEPRPSSTERLGGSERLFSGMEERETKRGALGKLESSIYNFPEK